MDEELTKADMLTGYKFYPHPHSPTTGILRLETQGESRWLLVTESGLRQLAEACLKHADDLKTVQ